MIDLTPTKQGLDGGADVFEAGAPLPLWGAFLISLMLILITAAHMQVTNISDNIGFSSNRDFYYANLHPIRTMLRTAAFAAGLSGIAVCLRLLTGYRRADLIRALLIITAFCALFVLAGIGIVGVSLIFKMLRSSGNLVEASFVVLQAFPAVLILLTVSRLFRLVGHGRQSSIRLAKISTSLILLQGLWVLFGGVMLFVVAIAALLSGSALALSVGMLARFSSVAVDK